MVENQGRINHMANNENCLGPLSKKGPTKNELKGPCNIRNEVGMRKKWAYLQTTKPKIMTVFCSANI